MLVDIIRFIIVAVALFFILKRFLPVKNMKVITGDDLKEILKHQKDQYQFVDVSIPREYHSYHLDGFKNIPLKKIRQEANQLDKNKPIILICQSGHISKEACRRLQKLGFHDLTIVKGGISLLRD